MKLSIIESTGAAAGVAAVYNSMALHFGLRFYPWIYLDAPIFIIVFVCILLIRRKRAQK